jgi:pantothenate synthetase
MIFNHIRKLKAEGKTIGITFTTIDKLHAGHIAMLSEAMNPERDRIVKTRNIGDGRSEVS